METDDNLGSSRRSSPKLDPPGSTESSRMTLERQPHAMDGTSYLREPTIDLLDSPEEDFAFRLVIEEARRQQDRKILQETHYRQHRYDARQTPPAKSPPFYSLHRTPEPPTPVRTPTLTASKLENQFLYPSSSKHERYSRRVDESRWTETSPSLYKSFSHQRHRPPYKVETNHFLTREHNFDQSPKISFTKKTVADTFTETSGAEFSFPTRKNQASISVSLETPDLAPPNARSEFSSKSSLRNDNKANIPFTASVYPETLSETFESIERDGSLRSLVEQVQKQREELIQSLVDNPPVPKKDRAKLRKNVKAAPHANFLKSSLLDVHDKEQHKQFTFDHADERISMLSETYQQTNLREGVKAAPQETLAGASNVTPNEHAPINPTVKDSAPALGPRFGSAQTLSESLNQVDRDSNIKSLLELVNMMQDTINRQETLISFWRADNGSLLSATMKKVDPHLPLNEMATTEQTAENSFPQLSSSVDEKSSSAHDDVSSVIDRHWLRLRTIRRKHGWE